MPTNLAQKNQPADRLNKLSESQTLAMARKSREMTAQGINVINLSIGEPDFDTPQFIKDAAKEAMDANFTHYTPVPGFLDLRQAISAKFKRENNLVYSPEQIVVSTGAKQSIANVILSIINEGEEVIVPTPYWVSYIELIKLADGIPVEIKTNINQNFKISAQQLEDAISEKTRMIIFSTPCNPSGSVYSFDELKELVQVLEKYPQIIIISDEIYEHINYVGNHQSIAQFESVHNNVVTVNGVSKGYAMTGWRIGYIGAPLWIAKACEKMQGQFTSGTCSISQKAALAAVSADAKVLEPMQKEFAKRRTLVLKLLSEIPGIICNNPQGAFYVFPDITYYFGKKYNNYTINNSSDFSMFILEIGHVAVVSGDAFGDDNCFRFSYACSEANIIESIKRIKETLAKLN
jgi:aspartate aminotransferase